MIQRWRAIAVKLRCHWQMIWRYLLHPLTIYVDVDGEDEWDVADLNVVEGPSDHTVFNTKFTELQETCRRSDVAVSSSIV